MFGSYFWQLFQAAIPGSYSRQLFQLFQPFLSAISGSHSSYCSQLFKAAISSSYFF
jgi:hypothetical protein